MSDEMPKREIRVTTNLFKTDDAMHIQMTTEFGDYVTHKIVALEEQAIRDALKRLGWKAPDEPPTNNGGDLEDVMEALNRMRRNASIGLSAGDYEIMNPEGYQVDYDTHVDDVVLIRTTLSQQAAEIEQKDKRIAELEHKLSIANYAFDLCHRYNGNLKSEYFKDAEEALSNTGEKGGA